MHGWRVGLALLGVLMAGCGGVRAKRETAVHCAAAALHHPVRAAAGSADGSRCSACGGPCVDPDRPPHYAYGHSWSRDLVAARDAATVAAIALADPTQADPTGAIARHNAAVERLLRLAWGRGDGANASRAMGALGLQVVGANPQLDPNRIEHLDIAADFRVSGLTHRYVAGGLGVPVVVRWMNPREARRTVQEHYYPEQVVANATAVLHPGPAGGTLTLHDPFEEPGVAMASGPSFPLAADRSVAIAVQVERDRSLRGAAFGGALTSNLRKYDERLAMLRPHHAGRIPVLFVHGLASSPLIFAETLNELGNDPDLMGRFEFWLFLYASGEPIPLSAAKLREALAAARRDFDPAGSDPTLQQMVVVGHSQGGLLTKTLVQDSGLTLWDEVFNIPHPADRLAPEIQARLDRSLIFTPDPGVRRLVFIATPHRGSPVADNPLVRGLSGIARPESTVVEDTRAIRAAYGRESIEGGLRGDILGLGNLQTASPVLAGLNKIPLSPAVPHHTIAMQLDRFNPNDGDGLVPYASSHLATAASEVIVSGFHLKIDQSGVTDELRRILRLLLAEGAPAPVDALAPLPD